MPEAGTGLAVSANGVRIAYVDVDPSAPGARILMVHATGFCKEVWTPVVAETTRAGCRAGFRLVDLRSHGASDRSEPPLDWWDLGRDVLAASGGGPIIGVGHSAGAAALVFAEILQPGTFRDLLLVEPIIFPGPVGRSEHPLADAARRRQARFSTRQAARERFASRRLFARWDERALDAYVDHGLVPADDGFRLACRPEDEAEYYVAAQAHGGFGKLSELDVPATIMGGADSDSHPRQLLRVQSSRIRGSDVQIVAGATHFVPMERPDAVAAWLIDRLDCSEQEADR